MVVTLSEIVKDSCQKDNSAQAIQPSCWLEAERRKLGLPRRIQYVIARFVRVAKVSGQK